MDQLQWRDILARTAKTFVAAFLAAVPVTSIATAVQNTDWSVAGQLVVGGALAGVAALVTFVWNLLLDWSR